jgi:hypothetical protein
MNENALNKLKKEAKEKKLDRKVEVAKKKQMER